MTKDYLRYFAVSLAILAGLYVIGFLATGGDLAIYRFWAPKQANAERVVFENTQGYVQGKTEYLAKLRLQYEDDPRPSLRTMILTEASTVDSSKLPIDLQAFITRLREVR